MQRLKEGIHRIKEVQCTAVRRSAESWLLSLLVADKDWILSGLIQTSVLCNRCISKGRVPPHQLSCVSSARIGREAICEVRIDSSSSYPIFVSDQQAQQPALCTPLHSFHCTFLWFDESLPQVFCTNSRQWILGTRCNVFLTKKRNSRNSQPFLQPFSFLRIWINSLDLRTTE